MSYKLYEYMGYHPVKIEQIGMDIKALRKLAYQYDHHYHILLEDFKKIMKEEFEP